MTVGRRSNGSSNLRTIIPPDSPEINTSVNHVSVRMAGQVGISNDPLKIPPVSVNVASGNQRTLARQMNQVPASKLVCVVGLHSPVQQINHC